MAFFGVTIETISEVTAHGNADRLEVARCKDLGFVFVVPKGTQRPGDRVLYIPIDAIIPAELAEKWGVRRFLAGKNHNRVKTVRLRGEISQGLVMPLKWLAEYGLDEAAPPEAITQGFGITQYEPPVLVIQGGKLRPLPAGLSEYDIEGAERHLDVLESLLDQPVVVMEKIEGSNLSVTVDEAGALFVNQRHHTIEPDGPDTHTWWVGARQSGLIAFAQWLHQHTGKHVTVYGELIGPGIQGNLYRLKTHTVLSYDAFVDRAWVPWERLRGFFAEYPGEPKPALVPVLGQGMSLREWLEGRNLRDASNGPSTLAETPREGIVIKPLAEGTHPIIGRLIIKQRSPEYLSLTDN